jgi:uncharacterized protein (TIGR02996 family)
MTDAAGFVAAIRAGDFDAAGVFADWLQERGDPRGVLLRRRWRRWHRERTHEALVSGYLKGVVVGAARDVLAGLTRIPGTTIHTGMVEVRVDLGSKADDRFRRYVRDRFEVPT